MQLSNAKLTFWLLICVITKYAKGVESANNIGRKTNYNQSNSYGIS